MRPCVKKCYDDGVINGCMKDSDDFVIMRHAIITELRLLGADKNKAEKLMAQWNDRCKPPLLPNAFRRKITLYIKWAYEHECRLSCKKLDQYCIYDKTECPYKNLSIKELSYNMADAIVFLERNYAKYGRGRVAGIVLMALIQSRKEKGTNILFCSMEEIVERVYIIMGHRLEKMQASRAVRLLEEAGFIKINSGSNRVGGRRANEYTFFDWEVPIDKLPDKTIAMPPTQISPMGNTSLHNMGNSSDSYMGNTLEWRAM